MKRKKGNVTVAVLTNQTYETETLFKGVSVEKGCEPLDYSVDHLLD